MFVGDGINDSPAIKASDLGVAINTKQHITVNTANVVLMNDNL